MTCFALIKYNNTLLGRITLTFRFTTITVNSVLVVQLIIMVIGGKDFRGITYCFI